MPTRAGGAARSRRHHESPSSATGTASCGRSRTRAPQTTAPTAPACQPPVTAASTTTRTSNSATSAFATESRTPTSAPATTIGPIAPIAIPIVRASLPFFHIHRCTFRSLARPVGVSARLARPTRDSGRGRSHPSRRGTRANDSPCGRRSRRITSSTETCRVPRRHARACRRAFATEICGSSPDPDAVTASTGTRWLSSRSFSSRYACTRSATVVEELGVRRPVVRCTRCDAREVASDPRDRLARRLTIRIEHVDYEPDGPRRPRTDGRGSTRAA